MIEAQRGEYDIMVNWVLFCSFIISLTLTLLGVLVDLTYSLQYQPKIEKLHSDQGSEMEILLQEQNFFHDHPVFNAQLTSGPNLFDYYMELLQVRNSSSLVKPSYKREFMALGKKWTQRKDKVKLGPPMTHFFANLEQYTQWTPTGAVPTEATSDLVISSQVFLAYHLHFKTESLKSALEKTRYLAKLLMSSEDLEFKRTALSILEKEHDLLNELNSRYRQASLIWTPVSRDDMRRFRQSLKRTHSLLSPISETSILKQVFLSAQPPIGFCAIYRAKVKQLTWSQQLLQKSFPFEPSFHGSLQELENIKHVARKNCQPIPEVTVSDSKWVARLPFVRRIYALKMIFNARQVNEFL